MPQRHHDEGEEGQGTRRQYKDGVRRDDNKARKRGWYMTGEEGREDRKEHARRGGKRGRKRGGEGGGAEWARMSRKMMRGAA